MRDRGSILLETVVALAIFATVGLLVLSSVREGLGRLEQSWRMQQAVDLARSSLARLEGGLTTIEELDGPVLLWDGDISNDTIAGEPEVDSRWMLDVEVEPAEFSTLTRVTIHVHDGSLQAATLEDESPAAIYSLTQLVRLGEGATPDALPENDLMEEIRRSAQGGGF